MKRSKTVANILTNFDLTNLINPINKQQNYQYQSDNSCRTLSTDESTSTGASVSPTPDLLLRSIDIDDDSCEWDNQSISSTVSENSPLSMIVNSEQLRKRKDMTQSNEIESTLMLLKKRFQAPLTHNKSAGNIIYVATTATTAAPNTTTTESSSFPVPPLITTNTQENTYTDNTNYTNNLTTATNNTHVPINDPGPGPNSLLLSDVKKAISLRYLKTTPNVVLLIDNCIVTQKIITRSLLIKGYKTIVVQTYNDAITLYKRNSHAFCAMIVETTSSPKVNDTRSMHYID